jgi:hypothetical protein
MALIQAVLHENPNEMDTETYSIKVNQAIWLLSQVSDLIALGIAKALSSNKKK